MLVHGAIRLFLPGSFLTKKLFDREYFREMMRDVRTRERKREEELKVLLGGSRSDTLILLEEPCLDSIPGLTEALNGFIGTGVAGFQDFLPRSGFSLEDYRSHLLSVIGNRSVLFSDITPLIEDWRKDKIWRFVTLIFMRQDNEVSLTQYGPDNLVERVTDYTDECGHLIRRNLAGCSDLWWPPCRSEATLGFSDSD